ncbi:hypothetical protein [Mesorhizobium sp. DCY119]|uniref:hypothetical protein n=1 Tax=Mesorhizobium sp. DCY119 TaxID=2108445 RepID=UPI000E6C9603|nr:hypothetical protein [Mesorhizobium sp. DCY119]RJG44918.1 hypothetical protein D3Y55_12000 [Mesorhizobium sp. DCY119]
MRDLSNNIGAKLAVAPAVLTATTNGLAIDVKDFGSCAFVINTGAIAGAGLFTAKLQESDTGSSAWTDVAPEQITGALPAALEASSSAKAGYIGYKRYVRLVLTLVSGTSIAAGAVAILDHAAKRPVA